MNPISKLIVYFDTFECWESIYLGIIPIVWSQVSARGANGLLDILSGGGPRRDGFGSGDGLSFCVWKCAGPDGDLGVAGGGLPEGWLSLGVEGI